MLDMKTWLLGSVIILAPQMAAAGQTGQYTQDGLRTGWYVSVQAGANWLQDQKIYGTDACCVYTPYGGVEFDAGWFASFATGYALGQNWNVELELAYRHNDIDCLTGAATTCAAYQAGYPKPGLVWQFSQFANVRYDIPVGPHAYVGLGAGIGGSLISAEDEAGSHDDDYVLAGQLIGQAGYRISKRADIFVDYRYMVTDEPVFANLSYVSGKLDTSFYDVENQTLSIGVRFGLQDECCTQAAPPPPAPPAPPKPQVEVPREFLVFFGFNKFNLTPDAQRVIAEAVTAASHLRAERILVVGHADSVGSPKYNASLSERRADAVRSELVRLGFSSERIVAEGRGESEPLVPTGDNVREPQNRRVNVTIVINAATH